jgi:hypothetical protein
LNMVLRPYLPRPLLDSYWKRRRGA